MTCIHQAKKSCSRCHPQKVYAKPVRQKKIRTYSCPLCSGTGKIPESIRETLRASRRIGGELI